MPDACPLIVPECFSNKTPGEIATMVDDTMDELVEMLTHDRGSDSDRPELFAR